MEGTVRWFNNTKGYGFIGRDDGPDVFVHYTAIAGAGYKTLSEGDQVEFEIVQGPKGPQAANVTRRTLGIGISTSYQSERARCAIIRILVVDDSDAWRRFVFTIVQQESNWHIVGEAADGLEAVQRAEELKPDLILLDIGLPKLNGIEAARQIRKLVPNSKILFLTQQDSSDIAAGALSTGASGYILKSDAGNELLRAVEAVIQGKRFVSRCLRGQISADLDDVLPSPGASALPPDTKITPR